MKKIFFYAFGLMCALSAQAAVIQVTSDKSGTELQAAINAASSGDTLKVQAGTYYGNFTMKQGVNVIGGWDANFETQTDYATILDAQENGRVVNQEAAFDVLTVWENLTIQNGKFTAQNSDLGGPGVALFANGQVKHCEIRNNIYTGESGTCNGGGVFNNAYTDKVLVDDCYIHDNTASHGGGVRICGVIQNSIIENNTTTNNACGGVQLHYGGAMYNCIIRGNTGIDTGGVRITGTKPCSMANCLIVGNIATNTIGGLQMANDVAHKVYNNTIVGNKQNSSSNAARCGVHLNVNADAEFVNNIVYGNTANNTPQADQLQINGNYKSSHSAYFKNNAVVLASTFGTNTTLLTEDPGFTDISDADVANNNYSLLWTSSLINAGNDSKVQGSTDLAGNARKAGDHVDIGAYELPYYTLTIAAFDHATLTVGGETKTAGDYSLPKGYTTTATIEPDENYSITSVTCDDAILTPEAGIYTLPALLTDMTLTITVQSTPTGIDDANTAVKAVKVIRNGQLLILRDGKEFNVLGSQL